MTMLIRRSIVVAALCAAVAAAGCSGNSQNASSQASAAPVATTEGQREMKALPLAQAQPVPKDIGCTGDDVVWVNLSTKSYHEPSDPYFGRTKNGKYMCKAAADAAGYHLAGSVHHHHMGGGMGSGQPTPTDNGT